MKRSGCRTILHIYLICFLALLGTVLLGGILFFVTILLRKPDGRLARSDWPKEFTQDFREQIIFPQSNPQVTQAGMELLQENKIGIQILDDTGCEVFSFRKPPQAGAVFSGVELFRLIQTGKLEDCGEAVFAGSVSGGREEYIYVLYFPMDIDRITMYVNGERFSGGKAIVLPILLSLLIIVLLLGVIYGYFTTSAIKRLTDSIREISAGSYFPVQEHGVFQDLYDSLNTLEEEIRASSQLRARTEKTRKEWIANITHDLKTPLSPIRGYAEILRESGGSSGQCRSYAGIMLKNVSYMEALIDDLKLTYQLDCGMLPVNRVEQNIVRFLKELAITILNTPEYENRTICFESSAESILFSFDETLLTRAFRNLIINAFVHGEEDTQVFLSAAGLENSLVIRVADNGKGMEKESMEHLFDRYYRGENTEQKPEGSGLGLAIAKGIVELHGGNICVTSIPLVGTTFQIDFLIKVN